jgi:hypothetical protein
MTAFDFFHDHSAELMILALTIMVLGTLLLLAPRLVRSRHEAQEMQHKEHMRALELGQVLPHRDERSLAAGRTATLVPMVVMCTAGTVTCFLVAYKIDNMFAVALAAWTVSGVVSLAAITGGVALMGRLAQLEDVAEDEKLPEKPLEG